MRVHSPGLSCAMRMANPPTDIEPSELFLKLKQRPAPNEVFAFPRRDETGEPVFSVRVFVLPQSKLEMCQFRVRDWMTKQAKDKPSVAAALDEQILGDRLAKELLAEAIHEDREIYGSADHGAPQYHKLFRNADDVGELTADEMGALYGAYLLTQMKFGPTDTSFADEAEVNAWVERLATGARPFSLTLLQSHQQGALLQLLAGRVSTVLGILSSPPASWQTSLESLRTSWRVGTGSSTTPAANSTPSPSEPEECITPEDAIRAAREMRRQSRVE